jgi:serine protease Do
MRVPSLFALVATSAALLPAGAQRRTLSRIDLATDGPGRHRAALGVATVATGTRRDTLGLMISAVTPGSPAARAGLEEGNRIAAINGTSLRASGADVEDEAMAGTLARRLVRVLSAVRPGDEVDLRVYRDGRTAAVKVRTADSDSLFGRASTERVSRAAMDDRPALGFGIGSSGSRRDTLGVLVMSVPDSTPAARASLEEGNRIAAVDGVNLRVAPEDAGDPYMGRVKAQRLQREIAGLTPGSDVMLRVYANGQFRDVKLTVARSGDLPRSASRMMILGGSGFDFPAIAPMSPMSPMSRMAPMANEGPRMRIMVSPDGGAVHREAPDPSFREQMQVLRRELELLGPEMQSIAPVLERLRPQLERMRTELPEAVRRARAEATSTMM